MSDDLFVRLGLMVVGLASATIVWVSWLVTRNRSPESPALRVACVPTPRPLDRLAAVARLTRGAVITTGSRLGGHVRFDVGFERRRRSYLYYEARPGGEARSVLSLLLPGRALPRVRIVSHGSGPRREPEDLTAQWDFTVRGDTAGFTPSEEVLARLHRLREVLRGDPRVEVLNGTVRLSVRGWMPHTEAGGTFVSRALSVLEELDDELQEAEESRAIRVVAVSEHMPSPGPAEAVRVKALAVAACGAIQCQVCGDAIEQDTLDCPNCRTPHHRECWAYLGGCSTYGCGAVDGPPGRAT